MDETTKITTQSDAFDAIRQQGYIVGSIDYTGCISFSPSPKVHYGPQSARSECARLAKTSPGKAFFFVKLVGAEMVPTNTISI